MFCNVNIDAVKAFLVGDMREALKFKLEDLHKLMNIYDIFGMFM